MRRIGFGRFPDWEARIAAAVEGRFEASFIDPAAASLDDFDAVVPLAIDHYPALATRPDLYGRRFFHPPPPLAGLCDDKLRLAGRLIAEGFSAWVPAIRAPGPPYPYVWKQRHGYHGLQCRVVAGPEDERGLDPGDPDWFAQAFIAGDTEYATHILRVGGEVRYVATLTYEMGAPGLVKGGQHWPTDIRMVRSCPHLGLFTEILARLGYEGTACIDYKLQDGAPRIFEINPRFGGSLIWDLNAYLDAYLAALRP